jgi:phosphoribosyl 1,2-cyclic phosphodiesterase
MKVRLWGTRGSLPTPGLGTERYGGNTACIEVRGDDPTQVIALDAGSGIRLLGMALPRSVLRVDLLLSHLHMDHILGLGFFSPLFRREMEVHIWGPSSATLGLGDRLARYLSPPLFPVRLNELACHLVLHDVPLGTFELRGVQVTAALVCHPGPTVGYRIDDGRSVLAYLPDHEPALGARQYPDAPRWTSGYDLATNADLLVHDAQYDDREYPDHLGWGHSTIAHAVSFAESTGSRHLVAFHHDPSHDDDYLDAAYAPTQLGETSIKVTPACEGATLDVSVDAASPAAEVRRRT